MKIEELNQLEKELTWIFAHVSWSNSDAKRKAALWTKNFLKDLRREANGAPRSLNESTTQRLVCSFCGKALPRPVISMYIALDGVVQSYKVR